MNFYTGLLAAGAVSLLPFAAEAATFYADQGLQSDGNAVRADRSDINSVSDGNPNTFFSLGDGGTLSADVSPALVGNSSVVEVTFGNTPAYPESAEVWLGGSWTGTMWDMTGAILLGELFNVASGASTTQTGVGGSTVTAVSNTASGLTTFLITIGTNIGSLLTLKDTTLVNFTYGPVSDGFDVSEFNVAAVPVPAAGFLLLAGLGGLAALKRRKTA